MTPTILVVDDDRSFRELVVDILSSEGYRLLQAEHADQAIEQLAAEDIDLVLTDQRMPRLSGLELARRVRSAAHPPAVVLMTAYGTIPEAVEAMRLGVSDYLTKPLESPAALRQLVRKLVGERAESTASTGEFLSRDPEILEMLALVDRAAATDATILITGESGTGKELLARRIHSNSPRSEGPFIAVNCAAIPENLAESELLGHEKGAFTGADRRRQGRFEQANGGTLFLDEIGELPEGVQAKLLRVIEDRRVERVGGSSAVTVDVRLVAATNRDLGIEVEGGRFRRDLFYRLNVVAVSVPPLRDRPSDIALLTPVLIDLSAGRLGTPPRAVSGDAMGVLESHSWPGNVRELRNVLERALIAAAGDEIEPGDLPDFRDTGGPDRGSFQPAARTPLALEDREREAILEALEQSDGHRERAAKLLGISVRTLYNRLRQYGIQ
jgi:DNA-binding NtrC family response regulator